MVKKMRKLILAGSLLLASPVAQAQDANTKAILHRTCVDAYIREITKVIVWEETFIKNTAYDQSPEAERRRESARRNAEGYRQKLENVEALCGGEKALPKKEAASPSPQLPQAKEAALSPPVQSVQAAQCNQAPYGSTIGNYRAYMKSFGARLPGSEDALRNFCLAKYTHDAEKLRGLRNLGFSDQEIQDTDAIDLAAEGTIRAWQVMHGQTPHPSESWKHSEPKPEPEPRQNGPGEGKPGQKLVCPKAADGSSNVCYWE
jgi:hypothetical protein